MISNATRSRLEALLRVVTNILNRTLAERSVLDRLACELANNAPPERLENVARRRLAYYMTCLASDMKMLLPISNTNHTSLYDLLASRQQEPPRLHPDSEPSKPIPIPQKPGSHHSRRRSPSRGTTPPTTSTSYADEPPAESLMPTAQGSLLIGSGEKSSSSSSSSEEDVPYARFSNRPLLRDLFDHSATVNMVLDQDHARLAQFLGQHVREIERVTAGNWDRGVGIVVQGVTAQMIRAIAYLDSLQTALKGMLIAHVSDYDSKSSSESPSPEPRRTGFFALLFWLIAGWCSK